MFIGDDGREVAMTIHHSRKTAVIGGVACVLVMLVAREWAEGRGDVEYRTATVGRFY